MNSAAKPFYGKGSPSNYAGRDDGRMMMWDATSAFEKSFSSHMAEIPKLLELANNLNNVLENTRALYNDAVASRDAAYRRLQDADNKLLQVENVVHRFATVQDPVIASDGFTYERKDITQYLKQCSESKSKAYSQQTKEELSDVIVSNLSLSRLVELLKKYRASDTRPPVNRCPITTSANTNRPVNWVEEEQALPRQMEVPVPASVAAAAAAAGGNPAAGGNHRRFDNPKGKMNSNNNSATTNNNNNNSNSNANANSANNKLALHPCLRVFGTCNFMDDCTFANYPYGACLNHIKGKCRFGRQCKELHVDPRDPAFQNPRSYAAAAGRQEESKEHGAEEENAAPKEEKAEKAEKAEKTEKAENVNAPDEDAKKKETAPEAEESNAQEGEKKEEKVSE